MRPNRIDRQRVCCANPLPSLGMAQETPRPRMPSGSINVAANLVESNRPEPPLPSSSAGTTQAVGELGPLFRSKTLHGSPDLRVLAVQTIRNRAAEPANVLWAKQRRSTGAFRRSLSSAFSKARKQLDR
jgi:hypothetical protein